MKKTNISEFGEFGLIDHLTKKIESKNETTIKGIGDDAAVLKFSKEQVLVTTDLLLEGIHFDLTYTPLKHLGYKAVVVNVSDIYAMNGIPQQITVSIGVDKRFSVEMLEEFYAGIQMASEFYNVDVVGGDTSSSLTGFVISITCIGKADEQKVVTRAGAKETDLICVTGNLGAAYMGLQLLEREKIVFHGEKKEDVQPDFAGKEYVLERQLKPEAQKQLILDLAEKDILPTAMMDISDGLSSEILHICKQSNVGCRLFENKIPIDYQTSIMAEEFNLSPLTAALSGGEDYEMLFTVPLKQHELIKQVKNVHVIGYVTDVSNGNFLISGNNEEVEIHAQGWNSFSDSEKK